MTRKEFTFRTAVVLVALVLLVGMVAIVTVGDEARTIGLRDEGYLQGQADYASGIVKVEKVEHPDQTVTWEWKERE